MLQSVRMGSGACPVQNHVLLVRMEACVTSRMEPVCVSQDTLESFVKQVRLVISAHSYSPLSKNKYFNILWWVLYSFFSLAVCPAGWFGSSCQLRCTCENDGHCHSVSGLCACKAGWTGPNCEKGKDPYKNIPYHTFNILSLWICFSMVGGAVVQNIYFFCFFSFLYCYTTELVVLYLMLHPFRHFWP